MSNKEKYQPTQEELDKEAENMMSDNEKDASSFRILTEEAWDLLNKDKTHHKGFLRMDTKREHDFPTTFIDGDVDGYSVHLVEIDAGSNYKPEYSGKIDGIDLDPIKAKELFERYKSVAMHSHLEGVYAESAKRELDLSLEKQTLEEKIKKLLE